MEKDGRGVKIKSKHEKKARQKMRKSRHYRINYKFMCLSAY